MICKNIELLDDITWCQEFYPEFCEVDAICKIISELSGVHIWLFTKSLKHAPVWVWL